ncbi:MAG: beta-ribofuranosylaminobenzene 5'-phosphate synthase [Candidatus Odinarchaeota archaeon]
MTDIIPGTSSDRGLTIITPSRLHFGLIDLNGEYGRVDGGSGISLTDPCWKLEFKPSSKFSFDTNGLIESELLDTLGINRIFKAFDHLDHKCTVDCKASIPPHSGLGSHTQLSMALVRGITELNGLKLNEDDLIRMSGRGGTSGIGIRTFLKGGFICDLGHSFGPDGEKQSFLPSSRSNPTNPPPVLLNYAVPTNWYFIIALPNVFQGASGTKEVDIFQEYCPVPSSEVGEVSRILLMKVLPGILQQDIHSFGKGLSLLQRTGFKKIEIELQDPLIKELLIEAEKNRAAGTGMSSFGPATYALTDTFVQAGKIKDKFRSVMDKGPGGAVIISGPNNTGAELIFE